MENSIFKSNNIEFKTDPYKQIIESIINKSVSLENRDLFYGLIEPLFIRNFLWIFDTSNKNPRFFERNEKFDFLKTNLSNPFLKESQKTEFLEFFSILQKGINGFKRLLYIRRFNKSRIYNTTDFCGDEIPINPRISITIYQNRTRYIFLLRDLAKTIISALSNTLYFFSEPISCKNPYTNIAFSKAALYNIYFALRFSYIKIPPLFQSFFLMDFDLYEFSVKMDEGIRDEYLNSYTANIGNHLRGEIREVVLHIFRENQILCMHIHRDFPEDRLLAIMKPYLQIYYKAKYSLQRTYANYLKVILKYSLLQFVKYNRNFGRRIQKRENIENKWVKRDDFNDRYQPFQSPIDDDFRTSHLSCTPDKLTNLLREIRDAKNWKFLRIPVVFIREEEEESESESESESDSGTVILVSEQEEEEEEQYDEID